MVIATAEGREESRGRDIGDAVPYALGQGIRIEIISILNEGASSETQIARRLRLSQSKVHHHLTELLKSGSIEEVEGRPVGNITERRYRALTKSEYSADDHREMDEETRRVIVGITLQNAMAEHLAAFRAGEIKGDDPNLVLSWDWLNLDEKGCVELTRELESSWKRMKAIEDRAADRRTRSGEVARSVVVSSISHPRVRPAPEEKALGSLLEPPTS